MVQYAVAGSSKALDQAFNNVQPVISTTAAPFIPVAAATTNDADETESEHENDDTPNAFESKKAETNMDEVD